MSSQNVTVILDAAIELYPNTLPSNFKLISRNATVDKHRHLLDLNFTGASLVDAHPGPQRVSLSAPTEQQIAQAVMPALDSNKDVLMLLPYQRNSPMMKQIHQIRRMHTNGSCIVVDDVMPGKQYASVAGLLQHIQKHFQLTLTHYCTLLPAIYDLFQAYCLSDSHQRMPQMLSKLIKQPSAHALWIYNKPNAALHKPQQGHPQELILAVEQYLDAAQQDTKYVWARCQEPEDMLGRLSGLLNHEKYDLRQNNLRWSPALVNRFNGRYLETVTRPSSDRMKAFHQYVVSLVNDPRRSSRMTKRLSDYRVQL